MADKGSGMNKFLILIILGGAVYFYYDKKFGGTEPEGSKTEKNQNKEDPEDPGDFQKNEEPDYYKYLVDGNYEGLVKALKSKENLNENEKKYLGLGYKELKQIDEANKIFSELYNDNNVSKSIQAEARVFEVMTYVDREDYKMGMEYFGKFIETLDPDQLPVIEPDLGDKLWDKFSKMPNHYWYEMHFAYALAYNGMVEENPRFLEIESRLNTLNQYIYFSKSFVTNFEYYVVMPNDNVEKIAKEYGINKELVFLPNNLTPLTPIRANQKLKIIKGKAEVKVRKNKYDLVLYLDGRYIKRYKVGLGKENKTPVGVFPLNASAKLIHPPWTNPDSGENFPYVDGGVNGNPLGTHWIPFGDGSGFGVHGTWDRESIGKNLSNGCIRMLNEEVEEIFAFLDHRSKVTIQ